MRIWLILYWNSQQAGAVLEKAQQTSEEQRDALADVAEVLGRKEILSHKDKVSNQYKIKFVLSNLSLNELSGSNFLDLT